MTFNCFIHLPLVRGICFLLGAGILQAESKDIPLKTGDLFIPNNIPNAELAIDLIIHLHGARDVVKRNLTGQHNQSVLINITLPGLSSVYRKHFEKSDVFPALLEESRQVLIKELQSPTIHIRHVTLMSFSAGFGGVRELLKQPKSVEQIDAIVMADSIYAGFIGEVEDRRVNDTHMQPFLAFAKQAVHGNKQLIISHTQLFTPDYASTKETAAWLVEQLEGKCIRERIPFSNGMVQLSHFNIGKLAILEFEGETGEDHMEHLRHIGLFLEKIHFE